jgi:hypothetical protein
MELNIRACRHAMRNEKAPELFDFSDVELRNAIISKAAQPGSSTAIPEIIVMEPERIPTWLLMHRAYR